MLVVVVIMGGVAVAIVQEVDVVTMLDGVVAAMLTVGVFLKGVLGGFVGGLVGHVVLLWVIDGVGGGWGVAHMGQGVLHDVVHMLIGELVDPFPAGMFNAHRPRTAQDAEMLRDQGLAHPGLLAQG